MLEIFDRNHRCCFQMWSKCDQTRCLASEVDCSVCKSVKTKNQSEQKRLFLEIQVWQVMMKDRGIGIVLQIKSPLSRVEARSMSSWVLLWRWFRYWSPQALRQLKRWELPWCLLDISTLHKHAIGVVWCFHSSKISLTDRELRRWRRQPSRTSFGKVVAALEDVDKWKICQFYTLEMILISQATSHRVQPWGSHGYARSSQNRKRFSHTSCRWCQKAIQNFHWYRSHSDDICLCVVHRPCHTILCYSKLLATTFMDQMHIMIWLLCCYQWLDEPIRPAFQNWRSTRAIMCWVQTIASILSRCLNDKPSWAYASHSCWTDSFDTTWGINHE